MRTQRAVQHSLERSGRLTVSIAREVPIRAARRGAAGCDSERGGAVRNGQLSLGPCGDC